MTKKIIKEKYYKDKSMEKGYIKTKMEYIQVSLNKI